MANERIVRARQIALPPDANGVSVAPFQFVLSGAESLFCLIDGLGAGYEVLLRVRVLKPDNTVNSSLFRFITTAQSNLTPAFFQLGAGALLNVTVIAGSSTGTSPDWASGFATVGLAIGDAGTFVPIATLVQSYITRAYGAVWPGTPFRSSLEGPGHYRARVVGTFAAGANILFQGNGSERYRVSTLAFSLSTSAVVGNRTVSITLHAVGQVIGTFWSPFTQTAGQTVNYVAIAGGVARGSIGGTVQIDLPPRWMLQPQDTVIVTAVVLDPGDQFQNCVVYGERWVHQL